jgi:hypothetical protein
VFIGGVGDQFINQLLDVHLNYLGNPPKSDLFVKAQDLMILMLHSVGSYYYYPITILVLVTIGVFLYPNKSDIKTTSEKLL